MGRILFFVGLAIVTYVLMRLVREGWKSRKAKVRDQNQTTVKMVRCPVCGAHFPENEAVLGGGVRYCSEACRRVAKKETV